MSTSAPIVSSKGPSIIEARKKLIKNAKERSINDDLVSQVLFDMCVRYNAKAYSILDTIFGENDRLTWTVEELSENDRFGILISDQYYIVREELNSFGFEIDDYVLGTCYKQDKSDSRTFKIGRILSRFKANQETINMFTHDKNRQASKKKYKVTLSRNVYDIITMSSFRGWSSCMGITSGNYTYVSQDISAGTLIIYVHTEDDVNIDTPAGRILLKPFITKHDIDGNFNVFYQIEGDSYGSIPSCAKDKFKEIQNYINDNIFKTNKITKGIIVSGLYNDGVGNRVTYIPKGAILDISNIADSDLTDDVITNIINTCSDHTELLKNSKLRSYIDYSKIKDFDKFIKILKDGSLNVYMDVIYNLYSCTHKDEILEKINEYGFFNSIPNNHLMKFSYIIGYENFKKYMSNNPKFKLLYKARYEEFETEFGNEKVLLTADDYKIISNSRHGISTALVAEIKNAIFEDNVPQYVIYSAINFISRRDIVTSEKYINSSLKLKMVYYNFLYRENDGKAVSIMEEFNRKFNTNFTVSELDHSSRSYYSSISGINGLVEIPFIIDSEIYEL